MAATKEAVIATPTDCKITPFYKGANILITGGTGFVGLALVEKLLRTLDVGAIYLLVRSKKGVNIEDRVKELSLNQLFSDLSDEFIKKVRPIHGDVSKVDLEISTEDKLFLEKNVNIVFHLAASLDFGESLKNNMNTNLLGTRRVLQLCKGMSNLKAVVHVSSAYVNSNLREASEMVYPAPDDVGNIVEAIEGRTNEELERDEKLILKDYPNGYTLTKFFAEHEVANCEELKSKSAIVRPSMITSAWKEPAPGWTISKNGPTGFFMGAAKGVVRRLPVNKHAVYDYVPVDVVVNTMLVSACYVSSKSASEVPVFHCTSSKSNPFRWIDIDDQINVFLHRYPLNGAVWYPYLKLLSNMTHFKISAFFVHFIPAYILDFIIKLSGGRPRLVRLHTSIGKSLTLLKPFIFLEWTFHNDNTQMLHKCLSEDERETFGVDFSTLKWREYFDDVTQGVRRYLHKEEPRTLEAARRKDFVLFVLHVLLMLFMFGGIWFAGTLFFGTTALSLVIPLIAYMLFSIL
ncbi:putative fatty acyl-CoA reductase CG8306 [Bacillus rossius redtenbacheri]|uniref:putative fatty acyl-CoA reductase CG8306 n=1 Tax=Bacillus rossius redtenbacheri TaxID=93214 RepID=UPI002FDDDD41